MKAYKNYLKATFPGKRGTVGQDLDAYLAGIFDGEGHISLKVDTRKSWGPYVDVGVTNTVISPLRLIKRAYGGSINPKAVVGKRKPAWVWRASGKDAHWALARMLPWLRIKQMKARLAIIILQNKPLRIAGGQVSPHQKMAVSKAIARFPHAIKLQSK